MHDEARARPSHRFYVSATAESETEHLTDANNGVDAGSVLRDVPLPRAQVEQLLSELFRALPPHARLDTDALRGDNPLGYLLSQGQDAEGRDAHPPRADETPRAHAARLQQTVWRQAWQARAERVFVRHRGFARDERMSNVSGAGQFRWQVKRTRLMPAHRTDAVLPADRMTKKQAIGRLTELWRVLCNMPRQLREMLIPMTRWQAWPDMPDMPAFSRNGMYYVELKPGDPVHHERPWPDGYARLPPAFFSRRALWDPRWKLTEAGHTAPQGVPGDADYVDADTCFFVFKFDAGARLPRIPGLAADSPRPLDNPHALDNPRALDNRDRALDNPHALDNRDRALAPSPLRARDRVLARSPDHDAGFDDGGFEYEGDNADDTESVDLARDGGLAYEQEELLPQAEVNDLLHLEQLTAGRGVRGGANDGADALHALHGGARPSAQAFRCAMAGEPLGSLDGSLCPSETRATSVVRGVWQQHSLFDGRRMWDVVHDGQPGVQVSQQARLLRVLRNGLSQYAHTLAASVRKAASHPLKVLRASWQTDVTLLQALQGVYLSHGCVVVPFRDLARAYPDAATRGAWVSHILRSCRSPDDVAFALASGTPAHNRIVSEEDAALLVDPDSWLYKTGVTSPGVAAAFDCAYAVVDWSHSPATPALRGYVWCRNASRHPLLQGYDIEPTRRPPPVDEDEHARAHTLAALPFAAVPDGVTTPQAMRNNLHVEQLCCNSDASGELGLRALPSGLGSLLMVYTLAARAAAPYHGVSLEVVWSTPASTEDGDGLDAWPQHGGHAKRVMLPDPRVLALYHEVFGFQRTFHLDAATRDALLAHGVTRAPDAVDTSLSVFNVGPVHPPYERNFGRVTDANLAVLEEYGRLAVGGTRAHQRATLQHSSHPIRDKALRSYLLYRPFPLPGQLVRILELIMEQHGTQLALHLDDEDFVPRALAGGRRGSFIDVTDSDEESESEAELDIELEAGFNEEQSADAHSVASSAASSAAPSTDTHSAAHSVASSAASSVPSVASSAAPSTDTHSAAHSVASSAAPSVASSAASSAASSTDTHSAAPSAASSVPSVASSAASSAASSVPSVASSAASSAASSVPSVASSVPSVSSVSSVPSVPSVDTHSVDTQSVVSSVPGVKSGASVAASTLTELEGAAKLRTVRASVPSSGASVAMSSLTALERAAHTSSARDILRAPLSPIKSGASSVDTHSVDTRSVDTRSVASDASVDTRSVDTHSVASDVSSVPSLSGGQSRDEEFIHVSWESPCARLAKYKVTRMTELVETMGGVHEDGKSDFKASADASSFVAYVPVDYVDLLRSQLMSEGLGKHFRTKSRARLSSAGSRTKSRSSAKSGGRLRAGSRDRAASLHMESESESESEEEIDVSFWQE